MIFLNSFRLPSESDEIDYIMPGPENDKGAYQLNMGCYSHTNVYPFKLFINRGIPIFRFSDITILYGGNGSGKSTILNLISEKLKIGRNTPFNNTPFFQNYLDLCKSYVNRDIPRGSRIITSDDVFEFLLDRRFINEGIESRRQELFHEYEMAKEENKSSPYLLKSIDDYGELKRKNEIRFKTKSRFTADRLNTHEMVGKSNGESGFAYFTREIKENALYLLDEPENSLSPKLQIELVDFLRSSVRFYNCQFIISTHSPFLLSMKEAKIYDLDSIPVKEKRWNELENMRTYFDLFNQRKDEFIYN